MKGKKKVGIERYEELIDKHMEIRVEAARRLIRISEDLSDGILKMEDRRGRSAANGNRAGDVADTKKEEDELT